MKSIALMFWCIGLILPLTVSAHSGRTNAEGCHTNKKTGEYHCHGASGPSKPLRLKHDDASSNAKSGCGGKYKCGEMDSCDEALHYLNDCGLSRLDGDNDGIPCESICGSR